MRRVSVPGELVANGTTRRHHGSLQLHRVAAQPAASKDATEGLLLGIVGLVLTGLVLVFVGLIAAVSGID